MAYACIKDVQARMTRVMSESEEDTAKTLLDDAAVIIDSYGSTAESDVKRIVSARMVVRALGDGDTEGIPVGATQGSMSALGYSQSWTIGSGGGAGDLYLSKAERRMLGLSGSKIGSYSPVQERAQRYPRWWCRRCGE